MKYKKNILNAVHWILHYYMYFYNDSMQLQLQKIWILLNF